LAFGEVCWQIHIVRGVQQMTDREMIAATLAAGLLAGKNFAGSRGSPEEYAVDTYKRMLVALDAALKAPPRAK
jgi:hypothetical protein